MGWETGAASSGNGSATLGLCLAMLSGSCREVKAQLLLQKGSGQEWKANPGTAPWKELPRPGVSAKKRSLTVAYRHTIQPEVP